MTSGPNNGYQYSTTVDSFRIYPGDWGKGYYDTGSQVGFNTGNDFTIKAENATHYGENTGTFVLGTLGGFGGSSVNIIMNQLIQSKDAQATGNKASEKSTTQSAEVVILANSIDRFTVF